MNKLPLLLAWRYIRATGHEKNISTMTKVAFLGVVIGTSALALVMAVMNGFESTTHKKMQNIHAPVSMRAFGSELDVDAVATILKQEFPQVKAFAGHDVQHVMIQDQKKDTINAVIGMKGINPRKEQLVTTLHETLKDKALTLQSSIEGNKILMGEKMAMSLGIKPGDTVNLLFAPSEQSSMKIKLEKRAAVIGGLFSTGIEEQDTSMIFCNLDYLKKLFPDSGITQIDLSLQPGTDEQKTIESLQARFGLDVYSWKDLYPALVAALKLEKYVMFFILALIALVASMNIISLLFMQITQKRGDIAILRSMGSSVKAIRLTFIYMGMLLSIAATIVGLLIAAGASWILQHYPFITLPDVYYVTHLPADMQWYIILAVFFAVTTLSFISILLPTQRIYRINIANVLRFEA